MSDDDAPPTPQTPQEQPHGTPVEASTRRSRFAAIRRPRRGVIVAGSCAVAGLVAGALIATAVGAGAETRSGGSETSTSDRGHGHDGSTDVGDTSHSGGEAKDGPSGHDGD